MHRSLAIVSMLALLAGIAAHMVGNTLVAEIAWAAGAVPALLSIGVSSVIRMTQREVGVDLIALLAIASALAIGQCLAAVVVGLMFTGGQLLEDYAEGKAAGEMSALLGRAPQTACRYQGELLTEVPIAWIVSGDRILVRGGDVIPVDGTVDSRMAVLDESALTGESLPVQRAKGEKVRSGVLNAGSPFDLLATTSAADSTYAGIVRMVEAARRAKAPFTRFAGRLALIFTGLTIAVAAAAWWLSGDPLRAVAVLMVATPCPLILAVPIAITSGMSLCASRGVLIKGGAMLERLAQGSLLLLDKTGTLTVGCASVIAIETRDAARQDVLLQAAASLEQASRHVLAEAIVSLAHQQGLRLSRPTHVQESYGAGIAGMIEGRQVAVGSYAFMTQRLATTHAPEPLHARTRGAGIAEVFVAIDGIMQGALLLGDEIRLEAPRAIRLLRRAGIRRVVMLTGDHRDAAHRMGEELGVDEVMADLSPSGKLNAIKAAQRAGTVLMVGDGINDAPALAAADVGVAMGMRGAAAASEAAGIVLLVDRLDRLAEAIAIARRTRRIALQSALAGLGLSLVAMGFAFVGQLPPVMGAMLQEGIDVAVIIHALRALRLTPVVNARPRFEPSETRQLKQEHSALQPILDRIRSCAEGLPNLPADAARRELAELDEALQSRVLQHEREDEAHLYPKLESMLGGDDPLAAMSRAHREIRRLARLFHDMTDDLPQVPLTSSTVGDIQGVLYGLDAILRLHFAQEDEIYHAMTDIA